jgi:hypothetical protein
VSFVGNDRFTSSGDVGSTWPKLSLPGGNGILPTSHAGVAAGVGADGVEAGGDESGMGAAAGCALHPVSRNKISNKLRTPEPSTERDHPIQ